MKCQKCGVEFPKEEKFEQHGQIMCEDCYMDSLSPSRSCDPWSTRSAQNAMNQNGDAGKTSELQDKIMLEVAASGGTQVSDLANKLFISENELEREIVTLHHMQKVKSEKRDDGKTYLVIDRC